MRASVLKAVIKDSSRSSLSNVLTGCGSQTSRLLREEVNCTQSRTFGSKSRGARGHGWLHQYRAGKGGRHLQGRYHYRDVETLSAINDSIFELGSSDCFLEIEVEGKEDGQTQSSRIVIELASTALPKTCQNFVKLCQDGYYKDTKVFRIERNVGVCLGDVLDMDGRGGKCHPDISLDGFFEDEEKVLSHTEKGIVTMLSPGVHRNDSRFCITLGDAPQLDGKYVAFGRVKALDNNESGMSGLEKILGNVFTKKGKPQKNILITSCGPL